MRRVALAAALLAAAAPGVARAAGAPPLQRPNPAIAEPRVDYELTLGGGRESQPLAPLLPSVMAAAVDDRQHLAYLERGDLGGFLPAPVGATPLAGGGRAIVGQPPASGQIPRYAVAAGGRVHSFAFVGGPPAGGGSENGRQPVPGLGVPPAQPPPAGENTVPPPNQGFGGRPTPAPTGTTTTPAGTTTAPPPTTTRPRPPKPPPTTTTPTTTTTTTATTTAPATTSAPATTTTASPPPPPAGSCGTTGLFIESNRDGCRIDAVNMAPGGAAGELLTIRNDTSAPFTLSLRASGTQNRLWQDLTLAVYPVGTAAPSPPPPLVWWTTQANAIATLQSGETIRLNVVLYLPSSAGNDDQDLAALVDLEWTAQGT